jgi:hypothetical protein
VIRGTRALDISCRACGEPAGKPCLAIVDGCVMAVGSYHKDRVRDAAKVTRDANAAARKA